MEFLSESHQNTFAHLMELNGAPSSRGMAALYLLARFGTRMARYVSPGEIAMDELLEDSKPWSSGERALVQLAAHLLTPWAWPCTVDEALSSLDADNFEVALEALRIAYGK
ncbi:hypothetical protein [Symbiobacterium thermophilum]|uniref:Uncharacterized protein n=1 Tax=Symbiobacterium thermophilum TaxID=2734 RepID=A0A953I608_SYMTR|nr:hypothetical protein [Symbiobacterium thermophilum]MBY6278280.1 hypothetical protein [Symbiobacterium thermophilum]